MVGLFFLGHYLLKDKIKSKLDLIDISSTMSRSSFEEYKGVRMHTYGYYIKLDRFDNRFQVVADFVDYFNKDSFVKTVKNGDSLKLSISRNDYNHIDNIDKIKIFGISKNGIIYLNSDDTINKYNNDFTLTGGLIFILVSLIVFYKNKRKLMIKKK